MKKPLFNVLSGLIGAAILLQSAVLPVSAEKPVEGFSKIAEKAGNYEMKQYGQSLQNGGKTSVKDTVPQGGGTTYYVDAINGNDENNGTSEDSAWKSVEKVNSVTYQSGDRILFKAGCEWTAPESTGTLDKTIDDDEDGRPDVWLAPTGSGTKDSPIVLGAYGDGELPKLIGAANVNAVIAIKDEQYWDISNLDISNRNAGFDYNKSKDADNAKLMGDLRGVYIYGQDFSENGEKGGVIDGYNLHDLYIHDITGFVYWGGRPRNRNYPGVYGEMGQDASKRTGGIIFESWKPSTGKDNPITFNDVILENNVVWNTSFGGICFKQWEGDGHSEVIDGDFYVPAVEATGEAWGKRDRVNRAQGVTNTEEGAIPNENGQYVAEGWYPHTNLVIKNNFVSQKGMEYGCNTIRVASVQGVLIEHNVCVNSGTCAIELDYSDDTVVQYNEVYGTEKRMGGADNNAIDTDYRSTNALIQYNYVYNNGDGILLCGKDFSTAVYRYNIVANSGVDDYYIALDGKSGYNYVYNNLFLNTIKTSRINFLNTVNGDSGSAPFNSDNPLYVYNNVFYNACDTSTGVSLRENEYIDYANNSYYGSGIQIPQSDETAIKDNPYFAGEISDDNLFDVTKEIDLDVFKINEKSPLVGSGKEFEIPETFGYGTTYTSEYLKSNVDMFGNALNVGASDVGINEYQMTEGKGIIRGRVVDEYGDAVEGAEVTASLTNVNKDYEIEITDDDLSDNTVTANIANNFSNNTNAAVILAVYDDSGALTYTDIKKDFLLEKDKITTVTFENIQADNIPNSNIKIMLWNSLDGMKPLCNAKTSANTDLDKDIIVETTDENGYYSFGEVKSGDYAIQTTKTGYIDSHIISAAVNEYEICDIETISLESSATTGTIEGTITCAGIAAENVTVTANNGGDDFTAITDMQGKYSLTADYGENYTLTVSGSNYKLQSRNGITIQKGKTLTDINFGIQSDMEETHTYSVKDNFDDYASGNLSSDVWAQTGTGSAIVTAEDGGNNQYLKISKSSGSFGVYTANDANLSGIVTIGARVMRTTGNSNQFNMFSYTNGGGWNSSNPISSSNVSATFAMSNGNLFSHYLDANAKSSTINAGTYNMNEWHKVWIVANMNTHTYDFYMDDNTMPVIINQPLRNSSSSKLDRFMFYSNAGNSADICVDYFYACTGVQLDETAVPYPVYDGSGTGTISGVVKDANGEAVADATLTISNDSYTADTATDENGAYSFENIPSAKGYTLTAAKNGYRNGTIGGINISNGANMNQNITLASNDVVYYINEDFNSYETGSFTSNDIWTVYGTVGTIEIAEDTENTGNKYLKLDKTSNTNAAFGIYNTENQNISGTVTIEARVKRTKDSGQYNQFSMYAFNKDKFNASNPTGGNTTLTFYMVQNKINTHTASTAEVMSYETNRWYELKIVADFNAGTFDFYVGDEKKLENQSFKNSDLSLDKFLIYSKSTVASSDLLVDYFRAYN